MVVSPIASPIGRSIRSAFIAATAASSLAASAWAAFIVPDGMNFGWTRGATAGSAYAQWDGFTSATGWNSPSTTATAGGSFAADAPAWGLRDASGGSFVTGTGNLYNPFGPLQAEIAVPQFGLGAGAVTTVILQIRTQGTEIDLSTVRIGEAAAVEVVELSRVALGGFGGYDVETLLRFELVGNPSGYAIRFDAQGPHMSLDAVAVDTFTQVVPGPGALAACLALGAVRSRRRRPSRG